MAHPGNPMDTYHKSAAPLAISAESIDISGLTCTVYGLKELPSNVSSVACLWLLHPRLQTAATMTRFAAEAISSWNKQSGSKSKGLIAVSFDQRNHGSRLVKPLANEAWKQGNPIHAQDMYATYKGTADDCSRLIDELPQYLPKGVPAPSQHIVLGVSLGAHAAWHNIIHDKRVTGAVIIIGCPDFARLMSHRASKSKLEDWDKTEPAGSSFFSSKSFPDDLIDLVDATDPAGLLLPFEARANALPPLQPVAQELLVPLMKREKRRMTLKLGRHLKGKAILKLSGGKDKLVPYSSSKPFMDFLKGAVDKQNAWWDSEALYLEDVIVPNAGHETTPEMMAKSVEFINNVLNGSIKTGVVSKNSKI